MQIDATTLHDLGITNKEAAQSVLNLLDFTESSIGNHYLRTFLSKPLENIAQIKEQQSIIQSIGEVESKWNLNIKNGTIQLVATFYTTRKALIPYPASAFNAIIYKVFNPNSYNAVVFTAKHFQKFLKKLFTIWQSFTKEVVRTKKLAILLDNLERILKRDNFLPFIEMDHKLKPNEALNLGHEMQVHKQEVMQLVDTYGKLDAWRSLAIATNKYNFHFPELIESETPYIDGKNLFHPLLKKPIPYDVTLSEKENFLFLTGANMAGKSTFIKAVGLNVYFAHLGIGVPAESLKLSYFDGLFSNIQITDNILQGESYFFNEVKRIKDTAEKVNDEKKWLVLIDELFKGTNVRDAMRCSVAVINGFHKKRRSVFLLSTHLYEIEEEIKQFSNIQFKYFETKSINGELEFSYQLKNGVSNDRIGYLILEREGVINLLENM